MSRIPFVPQGDTRLPVKVVFEGAPPEKAAARELLNRHIGQVRQFYLGQAQASALGNVDQRGVRRTVGPLTLHYTSNQGREALHIGLAAPQPKPKPEPKKNIPWDWAYLKVRVPHTTLDRALFRAKRVIPAAREPGVREYVYDSFSVDGNSGKFPVDGLAPPVLRYPANNGGFVEISRDDDGWISTLAIDLRRFNTAPVAVDIEGAYQTTETVRKIGYQGSLMTQQGNTWWTKIADITGYRADDTPAFLHNPEASQQFPWATSGVEYPSGAHLGAINVPWQDVPKAPLAMQAAAPYGVPIDLGRGLFMAPVRTTHIEPLYDAASGLLLNYTAHVFNVVNWGWTLASQWDPNHPYNGSGFIGYTSYIMARTITPVNYDVADYIPGEKEAEVSAAGGWGTPPWQDAKLPDDGIGIRLDNFALAVTQPDLRFLSTSVLTRVARLQSTDPNADTVYAPVGRFTVDPVKHALAFAPS